VLYISLHQDGRTLYPGSGFPEEFGGPNALGRNLNVPLPPRTSDEGMLYVMEHFVMPVLGEFKPDLIINSAGQDNHYSDPITNMSFTAGGYARLNEMLSPHICVLEGGYSIEAALPYVNTGIILALAGVDYSYIREPDLNPARIKEDPRIIDYIKRLTDTLLDLWNSRDNYEVKGEEIVRRSRNIFYDTDGISENQQESVRVCKNCSGTYKIDSSASTGYHILAVHIPWGACPRCREQGLAWFEKPGRNNYSAVYLQDMDNDEYTVKIP